jgi:hypothetical protein
MVGKYFEQNVSNYLLKLVNDIIYNDECHIVSVFKEYLIYDDTSEFLKRVYSL